MVTSGSTERHPFISLLLLLLLIIAGGFVFAAIAFVIGISAFGLKGVISTGGASTAPIELIRLLQILTSIGMFIVPAMVFARMESRNWIEYLRLKKFPLLLGLLCLLIMFSSAPVLELSSQLNKAMQLPDFLKGVEEWMRLKEQEMAVLTRQLLRMESVAILAINMLMLAVIPAIGEEFIFRGCIQKLLGKWTNNHHVAIWLTAIIFSAIHFQFYGFLPRMLLGAMFGYLFVWSRSIWIPVLAHFINNGMAVITAYVYQQKGISLDKLDQPDQLSALMYVFSIGTGLALLWAFYATAKKHEIITLEDADGSRMD